MPSEKSVHTAVVYIWVTDSGATRKGARCGGIVDFSGIDIATEGVGANSGSE
jgi:hypothetical protein